MRKKDSRNIINFKDFISVGFYLKDVSCFRHIKLCFIPIDKDRRSFQMINVEYYIDFID